ncbi:major facilitator superfamily domain-containing protein [Mycena epipterygia]|nr:major facilitator superfamily domain-containing protein [Mycena epipterygia]
MSSALELHPLPPQLSAEPSFNGSTVSKNDTRAPDSSTQNIVSRLKQHVFRERLQLFALYWCMFMAGWNDGTAGPLIPRIQKVYHVGFAVVSLTFVFACVGFIGGAMINVPLTDKLGSICQIIAYALQAPAPPFPVFVLSFVINGVGMAIQDAQANGYIASLKHNPEIKMGLLHGAYGAGALASPLVATQVLRRIFCAHTLVNDAVLLQPVLPNSPLVLPLLGISWHRHIQHHCFNLGIPVENSGCVSSQRKECLALVGEAAGETGTSEHSTFRQILSIKTVHLLAFFILVYAGSSHTLSTYAAEGRPQGLMTGRVGLLWLNQKIGERRVLYLYSVLAIGLELIVWLVPSLIGDAVAVSLSDISHHNESCGAGPASLAPYWFNWLDCRVWTGGQRRISVYNWRYCVKDGDQEFATIAHIHDVVHAYSLGACAGISPSGGLKTRYRILKDRPYNWLPLLND